MNARIAADSEAFLPWGGMLTSMSVGGTGGGGVPLVERNILKGTVSPGKAVAIAYVQVGCCCHHHHHSHSVVVVVLVDGFNNDI